MLIVARLPLDRASRGQVALFGEKLERLTPWLVAYGKADGGAARAHGNPSRDPLQPFGDHPFGRYHVRKIRIHAAGSPELAAFGPFWLELEPVDGQALEAARRGRAGIAIHAGPPDVHDVDGDGDRDELRPANGCLRLYSEDVERIVRLALSGMPLGAPSLDYLAVPDGTEPWASR